MKRHKSLILGIFLVLIIILCFVNIIIGLLCILIFSIIMLFQALHNMRRQSHCAICKQKLTVLNTPTGGRLKNGEQLCTRCFRSLSTDVAYDSDKYTQEEVLKDYETQEKNAKTSQERKTFNRMNQVVKPVLNDSEEIIYSLFGQYLNNIGYLVLTDQRLMFVYTKPQKKLSGSSFLSVSYYANSFTLKEIPLSCIRSVLCLKRLFGSKILLFINDFICEITFNNSLNQSREMANLIEKRAKEASKDTQVNIKITINVNDQ